MLVYVLCVCLPVLIQSRKYYLHADGRPSNYGDWGEYMDPVKSYSNSFNIDDLDDATKVFNIFGAIENVFPSIQADRIFSILTDFHDDYKNGKRFSTHSSTYFTHEEKKW
mmetsp:Transcript_48265/g.59358  ORF Transcript_48265/g.59358 Transcript_48265/m.59358 type:complete len:110 (+) Transcript_48265:59-388(+)